MIPQNHRSRKHRKVVTRSALKAKLDGPAIVAAPQSGVYFGFRAIEILRMNPHAPPGIRSLLSAVAEHTGSRFLPAADFAPMSQSQKASLVDDAKSLSQSKSRSPGMPRTADRGRFLTTISILSSILRIVKYRYARCVDDCVALRRHCYGSKHRSGGRCCAWSMEG
jgi:hypothetical protein